MKNSFSFFIFHKIVQCSMFMFNIFITFAAENYQNHIIFDYST